MKTPIPPIHERAEELKGLLKAERDAQKQQRLQALYFLQTQQARTRRQVAQLLGVSRNTVSRWLAAYETGGIAKLLTIAKAPGKVPLVSPAIQEALRQRCPPCMTLVNEVSSMNFPVFRSIATQPPHTPVSMTPGGGGSPALTPEVGSSIANSRCSNWHSGPWTSYARCGACLPIGDAAGLDKDLK